MSGRMKSLRQQPTVLKEDTIKRPDLATLACVNPECRLFRRPGEANLTVCKVYGHDHLRLLRCRTRGKEFSEHRGSALFNTKLPAGTAEDVINHLGEGCSVRATARLVQVAKETVARLLRAMPSGSTISTCTASPPRPWNSTSNGAL